MDSLKLEWLKFDFSVFVCGWKPCAECRFNDTHLCMTKAQHLTDTELELMRSAVEEAKKKLDN